MQPTLANVRALQNCNRARDDLTKAKKTIKDLKAENKTVTSEMKFIVSKVREERKEFMHIVANQANALQTSANTVGEVSMELTKTRQDNAVYRLAAQEELTRTRQERERGRMTGTMTAMTPAMKPAPSRDHSAHPDHPCEAGSSGDDSCSSGPE